MSGEVVHKRVKPRTRVKKTSNIESRSEFNKSVTILEAHLANVYGIRDTSIDKSNIDNAMLIVGSGVLNESQINGDRFTELINSDITTIYEFITGEEIAGKREDLYYEATVITDIQCPKCGYFTVMQTQEQTRSLDEGESVYEKCTTKGCPFRKFIR